MPWRARDGTCKQNIHHERTNKFNERPACEISTTVCPLCFYFLVSIKTNTKIAGRNERQP